MVRSDAQRNVERLKAAAVEVFRERGLGAPLEEIARRAGVSIGTLYNRVGSREELIDAVVPEIARANLDRVVAHALAGDDEWERVRRYLTGLLEMQITDPALSDAISSGHDDSPQLAAVCSAALDEGGRLLDAAGVTRTFGRDEVGAQLVSNAAIIRAGGPDAARRMLDVVLAGLRHS